MQTTAKTTETSSRRADHEAGTNGISAMPPVLDAGAPVQRMGEGEAGSVAESSVDTGACLSTTPNLTGLPDTMKSNLESASGLNMSDVRVHYNSSKPSEIGALAYTQGTDIHLGPGQEKHLGHEAWHTVQQKQGRVETTTQFKGIAGNDDQGLVKEADLMGAKVSQALTHQSETTCLDNQRSGQSSLQKKSVTGEAVQRKVGFEFQTVGSTSGKMYEKQRTGIGAYRYNAGTDPIDRGVHPSINDMQRIWREHSEDDLTLGTKIRGHGNTAYYRGDGWKLLNDGADMEFVTEAFDERTRRGYGRARRVLVDMVRTIENWRMAQPENQAWFRPTGGTVDIAAKIPDGMHAHPQTTMGIPLDSMASFLRRVIPSSSRRSGGELGWSSKARRGLQEVQLTAIRPFIVHLDNANSSWWPARLRGVIAFAVSAMASFKATRAGLWKDRLAFMHRTGFSDMVAALPVGERTQLGTLITTRTSELWQLLDRKAGMRPNTELKQPNDTNSLTVGGFMDTVARGGDPIMEWIQLEKNDPNYDLDQLAALRANRAGGGAKQTEYGMTRATDIGHGLREGMVMELRALPRQIPYTEWADFALRILNMYAEVTR